jgi:hypothetical protein
MVTPRHLCQYSEPLAVRQHPRIRGFVLSSSRPMLVNPIVRLEQLVRRHGSQRAAAEVLHVGESYFSDLLRGRRTCSDPILKKLKLKRVVIGR